MRCRNPLFDPSPRVSVQRGTNNGDFEDSILQHIRAWSRKMPASQGGSRQGVRARGFARWGPTFGHRVSLIAGWLTTQPSTALWNICSLGSNCIISPHTITILFGELDGQGLSWLLGHQSGAAEPHHWREGQRIFMSGFDVSLAERQLSELSMRGSIEYMICY